MQQINIQRVNSHLQNILEPLGILIRDTEKGMQLLNCFQYRYMLVQKLQLEVSAALSVCVCG